MSRKIRSLRYFMIVVLASVALFSLLGENASAIRSASATTAKADIEHAWSMAEASGTYQFKTEIAQTTYPSPSLGNVGRTSQTQHFSLDGQLDRSQDQMTLTFYPGAGRDATNAVPVRIKGTEAYGQTPDGQWQKIDNVSDAFAPGGDPLGYLSAAANIQFLGTRAFGTSENPGSSAGRAPASSQNFQQYAFDLDGEAFANYIRNQMERQIQDSGKLPEGISLSTPEVYRNSKGSGQIWLDDTGLPSRMTAQVTLPPQANSGSVQIDLQTDFYNFDHSHIAVAQATPLNDPITWATHTIFLPENVKVWQPAVLRLSLFLVVGSLLLYVALKRKRQFAIALNVAIIISIIGAPLFQSQRVEAFYQDVQTQQAQAKATNEKQAATSEVQAKLKQSVWDPHQDPLDGKTNSANAVADNAATARSAGGQAANKAVTNILDSFQLQPSTASASASHSPSMQAASSGTDLSTRTPMVTA